jgi:hypothetical protein
MECPICYEAITAETGVVTTSCSHSYHFTCISGWFIKQEKGTCPCCRKEMSEKEDFPAIPDAEAESETESEYSFEESEVDEVEFTRRQLQEFIEAHGGHLTEQMSDAICAVVGAFTQTELNSLLVGNTGQTLSEEEWNRLLERPQDSETVAETVVDSLRITVRGDERSIYMNIHDTAATKIQSAWLIRRAARTLIALKN